MKTDEIKIGVLTSSRADYGIYAPLLRLMHKHPSIRTTLIVFGMHLEPRYGFTIEQIEKDGYGEIDQVSGFPISDNPADIVEGYGNLVVEFSRYWTLKKFDCVLALGDRFEMSAAVQAGIPMEINFAHLHGGETTLGAVDNIYRHQITLASKLHFVCTEAFKEKVAHLTGSSTGIFNYGALSLDGLQDLELPDWGLVRSKFGIPARDFILITIHPETVNVPNNTRHVEQVHQALLELLEEFHLVITLTNADAVGSLYTDRFQQLCEQFPKSITLVDNFGRENYFAAMKASLLLLGNTSSGIIEAASFHRYVINLGDRQKGRLQSKNVFNVPFSSDEIITKTLEVAKMGNYIGENIYHKEQTAQNILDSLINAKL